MPLNQDWAAQLTTRSHVLRLALAALLGLVAFSAIEFLAVANGRSLTPKSANQRLLVMVDFSLLGACFGLFWLAMTPYWSKVERLANTRFALAIALSCVSLCMLASNSPGTLMPTLVVSALGMGITYLVSLGISRQMPHRPDILLLAAIGLCLLFGSWLMAIVSENTLDLPIAPGLLLGATLFAAHCDNPNRPSNHSYFWVLCILGLASWRVSDPVASSFKWNAIVCQIGLGWSAIFASVAWHAMSDPAKATKWLEIPRWAGYLLIAACGFGNTTSVVLVGLALALYLKFTDSDTALVVGATTCNSTDRIDDSSESASVATLKSRRLLVWVMAFVAVVARFWFWQSTQRVWEDGLITIQHAENAVAGLGLTHHPANGRVFGFTSPLGVLIPLLAEWLCRGAALLGLRLATLVAAAATILLAAKIANHPRLNLSNQSLFVWLAYLALDHSQIAFGIAGMETQFLTVALLAGAAALMYEKPASLAVSLSGAVWIRPDAVLWVGICVLGVAVWGFCDPKKEPDASASGSVWSIRRALMVGACVVLSYMPWLMFTTLYYGSPIPNTIVAKSGYSVRETPGVDESIGSLQYLSVDSQYQLKDRIFCFFSPYFYGHGNGAYGTLPLPGFTGDEQMAIADAFRRWICLLAVLGIVRLFRVGWWPIPAFLLLQSCYLACVIRNVFPWYIVSMFAVGGLAVAAGLDWQSRLLPCARRPWIAWIIAMTLVAAHAAPLPRTFRTEALIQARIENGVRKHVGLWLAAHAKPGEFVTTECLGYVGYYSRLPCHDFPGLCSLKASRVVVATHRQGKATSTATVIKSLRPEWIVIRPNEANVDTTRGYSRQCVVRLDEINIDPREYSELFMSNDKEFHIFRRYDGPGESH